jgi:hypothetical protein
MEIYSLSKLTKEDINKAGKKAAFLGELNNDFNLPHGFVISTSIFQKYLEQTGLKEKIAELIKNVNPNKFDFVQSRANKIQELIVKTNIPEEIQEEIIEFYHSLDFSETNTDEIMNDSNEVFVAVRSSPIHYLSSRIHINFFNIIKDEKLLQSIKLCWASLFTAKALYYYLEHDIKEIDMAVLIQRMLIPSISGRIDTVSQKSKKEMVIEACLGLGEAISSGLVLPDRYIVDKEDLKVLKYRVNNQSVKLICDPDEQKTIRMGVAVENAEKQKLDDHLILSVAKQAKKIESKLGQALRIEFAYEKDKLYILKAMPLSKELLPTGTIQEIVDDSSNKEFEKEPVEELAEEQVVEPVAEPVTKTIEEPLEEQVEEPVAEKEHEYLDEPVSVDDTNEVRETEAVKEQSRIQEEMEANGFVEESQTEIIDDINTSEVHEIEESELELHEDPEEKIMESPEEKVTEEFGTIEQEPLQEKSSEIEEIQEEQEPKKVSYPNFPHELTQDEEDILNSLPKDTDEDAVYVEKDENENKQNEINEILNDSGYSDGDHEQMMQNLENIGKEDGDSHLDKQEEINLELEGDLEHKHETEHSEVYEEEIEQEELPHQQEINQEIKQAINEQHEVLVEEEQVEVPTEEIHEPAQEIELEPEFQVEYETDDHIEEETQEHVEEVEELPEEHNYSEHEETSHEEPQEEVEEHPEEPIEETPHYEIPQTQEPEEQELQEHVEESTGEAHHEELVEEEHPKEHIYPEHEEAHHEEPVEEESTEEIHHEEPVEEESTEEVHHEEQVVEEVEEPSVSDENNVISEDEHPGEGFVEESEYHKPGEDHEEPEVKEEEFKHPDEIINSESVVEEKQEEEEFKHPDEIIDKEENN